MAENKCGSCNLCCKLLGIAELQKPTNKWCTHCKVGVGCQIYDSPEKPNSCTIYACVWLQSQDQPVPLGPELRPDRSKVVITEPAGEKTIVCHCDPAYPFAWQKGAMGELLSSVSKTADRPVIVSNGNSAYVLKNGQARQVKLDPPDENGVQRISGHA